MTTNTSNDATGKRTQDLESIMRRIVAAKAAKTAEAESKRMAAKQINRDEREGALLS